MFDLSPNQVKARFTALQYRETPRHFTSQQQAQAQTLAQTVRAIKPGVFKVGECFIDLWRNSCTCKPARAAKLKGKITACPHRVALWLAEGISIDDPDPAKYLRSANIQEPAIIASYCRAKLPACYPAAPQGFRILEITGDLVDLENVTTGTHATTRKENISHLIPFYE